MTDLHKFEHEAMNTVFTLRIVEADAKVARDSASAAIQLLDEIESKLSRYIEGSDVWQINHLQKGEATFISQLCYKCLRIALQANEQTGGRFDCTIGRQIEHLKTGATSPLPELSGQLNIDPKKPLVHCIEAGREIDLGGIGKGFALDRMRARLLEWGIQNGLLSAGASTHLAFGENSWPIELEDGFSKRTIQLKNHAISASGTDIQGAHIILPGEKTCAPSLKRLWVMDHTATAADVWSTACMLMKEKEIQTLIAQGAEIFFDKASAVD
ncbi:MAG: FAD:protein FMN transferase [Coraliomargaritaceae bacterium]